MIGKIRKGRSFSGCIRYALQVMSWRNVRRYVLFLLT